MEKQVEWVTKNADCREGVVNKSRLLWQKIQDALEEALSAYDRRCAGQFPVVVEDATRSDSMFRAVLGLLGDTDEKAILSFSVNHATKVRPGTVMDAKWQSSGNGFTKLGDQRFSVHHCDEGGLPVIESVNGEPCSPEEVARRVLEPMLFGSF